MLDFNREAIFSYLFIFQWLTSCSIYPHGRGTRPDIWVRQHQALTLEKAVHKLTAVPAKLFGIPNRGHLAAGKVADLVLFDPDRVAPKTPYYVHDFPRNGRRLICEAEGIEATFVAGMQVYERGTHTGATPGRVLRSYE